MTLWKDLTGRLTVRAHAYRDTSGSSVNVWISLSHCLSLIGRFMCGYSEHTDVLTFPEKYNMQHCLSAENMTSLPECRELLGKLFGDLECLKMVKSWHLTQNNSESYNCKCPS